MNNYYSNSRRPSRTYDRLSSFPSPAPPCRTCTSASQTTVQTGADSSLINEDRCAPKTPLDSVFEYGVGVAADHVSTTSSSRQKRSRISVINHPLQNQQQKQQQCTCVDLRREMDDLKLQLHRIESSVKDDTRTILELLKNNISNKEHESNAESHKEYNNSRPDPNTQLNSHPNSNSLPNSHSNSDTRLRKVTSNIVSLNILNGMDSHV